MSLTSFDDADKIVNRFIDLLSTNRITPAIGSVIEGEFLSPLQLLESSRKLGGLAKDPVLLADAAGMYDLAAKLLAIETQPEFGSFVPHLELFGDKSKFSTTTITNKIDVRDDVNRKVIELYLGSLAVHFAHNVQLDHPINSKGDNPDVMFEIRPEVGEISSWALAIKTVTSRSGQTVFENVQKAGKQIDATACKADRGMVVLNLKSQEQKAKLWGKTYTSLNDATADLESEMNFIIDEVKLDRPNSDWEGVFAGRTSPVVMLLAHAVVRLQVPGLNEVPTILKMVKLFSPLDRCDDVASTIGHNINYFMHSIHLGIPGTDGNYPK